MAIVHNVRELSPRSRQLPGPISTRFCVRASSRRCATWTGAEEGETYTPTRDGSNVCWRNRFGSRLSQWWTTRPRWANTSVNSPSPMSSNVVSSDSTAPLRCAWLVEALKLLLQPCIGVNACRAWSLRVVQQRRIPRADCVRHASLEFILSGIARTRISRGRVALPWKQAKALLALVKSCDGRLACLLHHAIRARCVE